MAQLNRKIADVTLLIVIVCQCCFIIFRTLHKPLAVVYGSLSDSDIDNALENLSHRDVLFDYFAWSNASSCIVTQDFGGKLELAGATLVGYDGQKALCLDRKVAPDPNKCLVYSFGINMEWSFDRAMLKYGCQVFAFDPSMVMKNHTRWYRVHFYRIGLANSNYEGFEKTPDVPMRNLKSIYDLLKSKHGDVTIDYLKIDAEFSEWQVLPDILASGMMDRVRQMSIEIHLNVTDDLATLRRRASVLRQVEKYGMVRFNSKPNMFSFNVFTKASEDDELIPTSYEIAYYNSRFHS